jgi:GNAT superfamily N-acetyltransferase
VRALIVDGLAQRWGEYDASRNPDLEAFAEHYGESFVVAARDAGGRIVGCGILVAEAPGVARIVRMSVADAWRRHGVGGRVLGALLAHARGRGDRTVVLETTQRWDSAVAFYRKHGFVETHRTAGDVHFRIEP